MCWLQFGFIEFNVITEVSIEWLNDNSGSLKEIWL